MPVDVTLLFGLCILFITATLYTLVRWYRRHYPESQTTICLQIGDLESSMMITWGQFLHQPDFYQIIVNALHEDQISITTNPMWYFFHEVKINGLILMAKHKFLDLNVHLTLKQHILFCTARQIKSFTQSNYFMALLLKDSKGKIRSCSKLKPLLNSAKERVTTSSERDHPSLYPALNLTVPAI